MAQVSETDSLLIDDLILDRQTMGDGRLAVELLGMFVQQLGAASREIAFCSFERRAALAHALKGTAKSLGIEEVAACAQELEIAQAPAAAASRLSMLAGQLRREVDARTLGSG